MCFRCGLTISAVVNNTAASVNGLTIGGTGTLTLHVGSKTAQRLRKLRRVSFLMRLTVRNTSGANVIVLAPATLAG